ncbi:sensor histidine kinase [Ramlibacter albus]|uniref:histidine kinase n=1 Tax=Ramlibacter albus TaxID=2079448 RepID=A0A923MBA1_9BURK|nr:hybrid sensor histidine kinase/response regulator [Ramlibacter albus]MBC5767652.1 response regulator [Ramlibacter albus]
MDMRRQKVLVVEDELVVAEDLKDRLERMGFEVVGSTDDAQEAIALASSARPDVVLMDIMLHGHADGIEAAEAIADRCGIPVIFLTAHSDSATLARATQAGPAGYVVKPFQDDQVRAAIVTAGARVRLQRRSQLAASWLGAAMGCLGDALVATDGAGAIVLMNQAAQALTGWTQQEAVGRPCSEVIRLARNGGGEPVEDPATRALRSGSATRVGDDTELVRRNGERILVDESASCVVDEDGAVTAAVVVLVDASRRGQALARARALETQVACLSQQAEREIDERLRLEVVAGAVSHDLRAPLSAINGFSEALSQRYGTALDAAGRHFLQRLRQNAEQMTDMMEEYLTLLREARERPLADAPVDMRALAAGVLEAARATLPGGSIRVGALPAVRGDEALLRRLLATLVRNASNLACEADRPAVELGATTADPLHTFYVRDNGRGFDVTRRLFDPFQRGYGGDQPPAAGLELAIARRIVLQHGGTLWAESEPGRGATFFFTLPAA